MEHQPKLHYENFNDALHDLVQALDGYKKVGPKLWPESQQEEAAQKLRHCLNPDRRERLNPHQVLLLLRMAREVGFHGAKHFLDDDTGYSRSLPVDPQDQISKLQREFIDSVDRQARLIEEIRRLSKPAISAVK